MDGQDRSAQTLKALSPNELAILLLSAYLHDIGMSPEWGRVEAHRVYLFDGTQDGLTEDELKTFQEWLAEREGIDFAPPVRDLFQIEGLVARITAARATTTGAPSGSVRTFCPMQRAPRFTAAGSTT